MPRQSASYETAEEILETKKGIAEYISAIPNTIVFGSFPREILAGGESFRDIDVLSTNPNIIGEIVQELYTAFGPSILSKRISVQEVLGAQYGHMDVESFATISFNTQSGANVDFDIVRPVFNFDKLSPAEILEKMYRNGDFTANFTYIEDGGYFGIKSAVADAKERKIRLLGNLDTKRISKMVSMIGRGWELLPSKEREEEVRTV